MPADAATLSPMLWLVAFQLGLYAIGWVVCAALLGEDRGAVAHWGVFLLLLGVGLLLAGARGEPRAWGLYNAVNVITLIGFAVMRRGTERFVRAPASDVEQAVMLALVGGAIALLGPGEREASLRIVLAYAGQGYIVLRTMMAVRAPLRAEFGRAAFAAIVVPGVVIALLLVTLALRQALDLAHPQEMQRNTAANQGLMYVYLSGVALFNFGFMVMLTQRLVVKLRRASRRDSLTGLLNRGAIDDELHRLWELHRRGGEPFALLLLDIDHFKRVNDTYGHAAGDRVLAQVAGLLARHARQIDMVGRYGGEEFLIAIPHADAAGAAQAAERLRQVIEQQTVQARGVDLRVTASIGVAVVQPSDAGIDVALARADRALYRAKDEGRNRVVPADVPRRDAPRAVA